MIKDIEGKNQTINIEIELILEAIFNKYGYDFRNYSKAHVKRRLLNRLTASKLKSISELQHKILHESEFFEGLLRDLSINVTEMFRDPGFYLTMRKEVIPILKTYPFIKVWHAGCSTGEEVYSFALILKEEGLYDRTQIYATDFNHNVLDIAKKGIYPIDRIKEFTFNYQAAGGTQSFSDYYIANYNSVIYDQSLKKNIVFAEHNLVTDSVFAEVNLVICRNVLIYFNKELQNSVVNLFYESLVNGGYLGLGSKETITFTTKVDKFEVVNGDEKIYKKKII
ncbi:MAG: protein-glutamate O-methyltransferase CheR [Bacteroidetes bacterium]|nr:protein-glutamate O-methyltransferase CheR [Bacteroidota bacterium]MBL6943719.1 protein-glutamate O-methyltransferase CheR [Bacteroidales bacterium]